MDRQINKSRQYIASSKGNKKWVHCVFIDSTNRPNCINLVTFSYYVRMKKWTPK